MSNGKSKISKESNACQVCGLLSRHLKKAYENYSPIEFGMNGSRLKSWELCHCAFLKKKGKTLTDEEKDFLSLNLAFYLASWGMYRGSSFLLDRDYKAHSKVVSICMERQYDLLWDYEPNGANLGIAAALLFGDEDNENDFGLVWRIKRAYGESVSESSDAATTDDPEEDGSKSNADDGNKPTDTLVTKILLGVFACIPAFDRYFSKAYKSMYKPDGAKKVLKLNKEEFILMGEFVLEHRSSLWYYSENVFYPAMKCLDLALWRMGLLAEHIRAIEDPKSQAKHDKARRALKREGYADDTASGGGVDAGSIKKSYLPENYPGIK